MRTRTLDGPKALDYTEEIGAGFATYTHVSSIVRATLSDFVADVELTARRKLSPEELRYFFSQYGDNGRTGDYADDDLPEVPKEHRKLDTAIRLKLGKWFILNGIFPITEYLKPVDVRGRTSYQDEHVFVGMPEVAC